MKKVVPFDIEKVKNGAKVITRNGLSVIILAYDVKNDTYPILGLVKLPQSGREVVYSFTENGKVLNIEDEEEEEDKESKFDLFIEEVEPNNSPKTTVQPKNREELEKIINDTIEAKGPNCDLNFIDTSLITNMSELFQRSDFNGNISEWNTSNVTDMSSMFAESIYFKGNISNWDVSNVEDMNGMFWASTFNSDLSKWNVSKVRDMSYMFSESEFNRDIAKWDVSNVTGMVEMFHRSAFNKDISEWEVSDDVCMQGMFTDSDLEEKGSLPEWYKS